MLTKKQGDQKKAQALVGAPLAGACRAAARSRELLLPSTDERFQQNGPWMASFTDNVEARELLLPQVPERIEHIFVCAERAGHTL